MKLTKEQKEKYLNDECIDLDNKELDYDWNIDTKFGFQDVNTPFCTKRMINLKSINDAWLRIPFNDLTQSQIEDLILNKRTKTIDEDKLNELANESADEYMYNNEYLAHNWDMFYVKGFKAGYYKAKEG